MCLLAAIDMCVCHGTHTHTRAHTHILTGIQFSSIFFLIIGVTSARGIQNDGEVKAPFELEATDPVAYSQVPK